MKNVIYILIQCTWGLPQTLLGFESELILMLILMLLMEGYIK